MCSVVAVVVIPQVRLVGWLPTKPTDPLVFPTIINGLLRFFGKLTVCVALVSRAPYTNDRESTGQPGKSEAKRSLSGPSEGGGVCLSFHIFYYDAF